MIIDKYDLDNLRKVKEMEIQIDNIYILECVCDTIYNAENYINYDDDNIIGMANFVYQLWLKNNTDYQLDFWRIAEKVVDEWYNIVNNDIRPKDFIKKVL